LKGLKIAALYRRHFRDRRRERQFLASLGFFVTFLLARIATYTIREGWGPLRDLWVRGVHVHHLVWGILMLLVVGYCWLIQLGSGAERASVRASRITALLYGAGAALTLDEFALWLNLEDVYWEREGRQSIDAVMLFGALVSAGLWGGPFLRAVSRRATRLLRRGVSAHPRA
jgi:hypothetical protein